VEHCCKSSSPCAGAPASTCLLRSGVEKGDSVALSPKTEVPRPNRACTGAGGGKVSPFRTGVPRYNDPSAMPFGVGLVARWFYRSELVLNRLNENRRCGELGWLSGSNSWHSRIAHHFQSEVWESCRISRGTYRMKRDRGANLCDHSVPPRQRAGLEGSTFKAPTDTERLLEERWWKPRPPATSSPKRGVAA